MYTVCTACCIIYACNYAKEMFICILTYVHCIYVITSIYGHMLGYICILYTVIWEYDHQQCQLILPSGHCTMYAVHYTYIIHCTHITVYIYIHIIIVYMTSTLCVINIPRRLVECMVYSMMYHILFILMNICTLDIANKYATINTCARTHIHIHTYTYIHVNT